MTEHAFSAEDSEALRTDSRTASPGSPAVLPEAAERAASQLTRLRGQLGRVILGKAEVIHDLVTALISGGHVLLEDVPGTGKTTLARALAKSLDLDMRRIQFTPDLLPSELTGINFYDQKIGDFRFRQGSIFTNILLADEINRATPRTQAALLESMQERQVSVDGVTWSLPQPFAVLATQNPLETQGTFPLPEAQLDRFLMRLSLGYPDREAELSMLETYQSDDPSESLEPVLSAAELLELMDLARMLPVSRAVRSYVLDIISRTRQDSSLRLGASPRASLALIRAAQARALGDGRLYVTPDHVKALAVQVLSHRIILKGSQMELTSRAQEQTILRIVNETEVPSETFREPADS